MLLRNFRLFSALIAVETSFFFQLGTGRFGSIKLAQHKESKHKIALKFFPRPQTKQVRLELFIFTLRPNVCGE